MADFFEILDTELEPDAPLISSLGYRWRDNPIAIFEGAIGAPVNQAVWHPYNAVNVADGNDGLIYDSAVDGVVASVATPAFVNGYEYRVIGHGISPSVNSVNLQVEFFLETSGVYAGAGGIPAANVTETVYFDNTILMPRVSSSIHFSNIAYQVSSPGAVGGAVSAAFSGGDVVGGARYSFSSGNIDAGKMYLMRRRELFS